MRRKFELDTSSVSVEDSLAEFVEKLKPQLTQADRLRILTHDRSLKGG